MQLSSNVIQILAKLEEFSGRKLKRSEDLGALLELAHSHALLAVFDRLAFLSKFAAKAFGIMERIGRSGQGYEQLLREFTGTVEEARRLLAQLTEAAPPEFRIRFTKMYLDITPAALEELRALFSDLSWYKNWRIDHRNHDLSGFLES